MPTISISRPHDLSHDEVREHIEELAGELQEQFDASYRWEGDTLHFSRSGANGVIEVTPDAVKVVVKLSMVMSPFKGKVEKAVTEYLDEHLG
jgi:putative polyhydroxyalkanoate system protein